MTTVNNKKYKYITISDRERIALNYASEILAFTKSYMAKESHATLEHLLERSNHTKLPASPKKEV